MCKICTYQDSEGDGESDKSISTTGKNTMKVSNFEKQIDPVIVRRGKEYWKEGRVEMAVAKDNYYRAAVHGTLDYTTIVETKGDEVVSTSCNCPYGDDCKHVAALLYEIRNRRQNPGQTADVQESMTPTNSISKGKKTSKTEKISFQGTEMTEKELFYLCYLAYANYAYKDLHGKVSLPDYDFHFAYIEEGRFVSHLKRTGWVDEDFGEFYYRKYDDVVVVDKVLLVLRELVENHTDWLQCFRGMPDIQTPLTSCALQIAEVLSGKREHIDDQWQQPIEDVRDCDRLMHICYPLLKSEKPDRLRVALPVWMQATLVLLLLQEALFDENMALLTKAGALIDILKRPGTTWSSVWQTYRMVLFYATGTLLSLPSSDDMVYASYYVDAVQSLYQGRLDESIQLFEQGLKQAKRKRVWKIIPGDMLSCLMYVIALGRRHSDKDMELLRYIADRSSSKEVAHFRSVFALADFFQSPKQPKNVDLLVDELCNSILMLNRSIAGILLYFWGQQDAFIQTLRTPQFAILRCEWAHYVPDTKTNFPYTSALAKVEMRPEWEVELEDLIREYSPRTASEETTQSSIRLCYIVRDNYDDIWEVREQNRLKNGKWGKGKKLSSIRYNPRSNVMDDVDLAIYKAWSAVSESMYEGFPSLEFILPFLKGTTDKLYRQTYQDFEPIAVREEKPFVYTEREGDNIVFRGSITGNIMVYDNLWLDYSNRREWVYYPMNSRTQDLLSRLLKLGKVPSNATPLLKNLFEAIGGQIEVHSDVGGTTDIEQAKGQTQLTLRITPQGEDYRCEVCVYPLPGGKLSFFPGESNIPKYYDMRAEVRVCVTRNLSGEKSALRKLNALLDEHTHCTHFKQAMPQQDITSVELLDLLELAGENESLFAIEWPEGKRLNTYQANADSWKIVARQQGGWFDIEGEIPLSDEHILTMSQLLSLLRESQGNYIRLSATDYVRLSDSLRRQLERIDSVAQTSGDKVEVPELAMTVLGSALQGEMEIEEPESLIQMRKRIRESEKANFAVPDRLNATLRDYQVEGYEWMMRLLHWGAGACLADDMGLGKTVQTIAVLLAYADSGAQMVVAPASVVGNWQREIARFAPSLNTVVLNDLSADERKSCIEHLQAGDILILTYGLLVSERESLTERAWTTVVLDEAHTIKNKETKSSAAAMQLHTDNRIILTGTPIQNHLGELWNLMQFINPGLLGSYDHFTERFVNPIVAGMEEPKLQLKRLIAPFTLRRTKQEVARELPDKTEIQVPVVLSDDEMAVYEVLRREAKEEFETSTTVSVSVLAMITKLREAACSASLVEKKWNGECSKLDALMDKLQPMVEQGNRVLIFSQFTSFLKMAKNKIEQAGITDLFYLDGSTPIKTRQRMVEAFQKGKGSVFLISLKAGGLGLNLTGANYVIHLDPWWNPAIEQQATDRAYRIGQQQKVTVYHLIAEHTIEEKIVRLHQTKQSLADSLLEGTNMSHKLTAKDLLELLG